MATVIRNHTTSTHLVSVLLRLRYIGGCHIVHPQGTTPAYSLTVLFCCVICPVTCGNIIYHLSDIWKTIYIMSYDDVNPPKKKEKKKKEALIASRYFLPINNEQYMARRPTKFL